MRDFRKLLFGMLVILLMHGCARTPQQKYARFIEAGNKQLENRDYTRAVLNFQSAIQAQPKEVDGYYRLGLAYLGAGSLREAIVPLRMVTELDPSHIEAQLKLSDLMLRTRDERLRRDAEARIQDILTGNPGDEDALFTLAATRAQSGRVSDAEKSLNEVLAKSPTHLRASLALALMKTSQNDVPGAEAILKQAIAKAPDSAEAAIALGSLYAVTGRLPEAEAQFVNATRIDPKSAPAWSGLGATQLKANKKTEAEETYKHVASLNTEHRLAYVAFLTQQNRRSDAVAELEKMFRAAPNDRVVRSSLVAGYLAANRVGDAEAILNEALKKNENDFEALLQRGQVYIRNHKSEAAGIDLDRAGKLDSGSAQVHYLRSRIYRSQLDSHRQRQELIETLRLAPESFMARIDLADSMLMSKNPKAALQTLDEAPDSQKRTLPFFIARNWALIAVGDAKTARAGLDKVMPLVKSPELQLQDAVLKMIGHDWAGARVSLEPVLKTDPEDIRALTVLAQVLSAQNQRAAATERIREIVALRPRSAPVQVFWAQWLLDNNQRAEARQALDNAKAVDPNNPAVLTLLATLNLDERRLVEARSALNSLLAIDHRNPDAVMLLAELEQASHRPALAMEHYRRVLALNNRHARALNNLAVLLSRDSTKLDDAMSLAQKAKELSPETAQVLDTLGWIYYRKGLYSLAAIELERAVANGQRPTIQYHLGLTYNRLGETTKGGRLIAAALAKEPKLADTEIP